MASAGNGCLRLGIFDKRFEIGQALVPFLEIVAGDRGIAGTTSAIATAGCACGVEPVPLCLLGISALAFTGLLSGLVTLTGLIACLFTTLTLSGLLSRLVSLAGLIACLFT
ncbi:hypothetical protein WKV53_27430, partial [Luteolibacter sp. Y139]